MAFHGAPRFTGDLDILIRPTGDNAARLLQAIEEFGFPTSGLTPAEMVNPRRMLELGVPPVQLHLMSAISGVNWDDASAHAVRAQLGRHPVTFIGREALIRNKRAAGRLKDRADIEALGGDNEA